VSFKVQQYLNELYGDRYKADDYLTKLRERGIIVADVPYGFVSYELRGDALIIYDMYVNKLARKQKKAWQLFNQMKDLAQENGKTLLITFSDKANAKPSDGLGSINAAGFKKAFETKNLRVFMRGL
jgi:GNAT superfamily N-acetyltransferase